MYEYIRHRVVSACLPSDSEDFFQLHEYYKLCWDTLLPIYRCVSLTFQ